MRGRGSMFGWAEAFDDDAPALWSAVRMACRNIRTNWRSSVALIRSTDEEIPTAIGEQNLRDAHKSLRGCSEMPRFIRLKMRAGQRRRRRQDGPFMTDVASRQHGKLPR